MAQTWDPAAYAENAGFVHGLAGGVLEWLAPQAGERILDLGCGDGQLTERLAESGAIVSGVDADPRMVEAAKARGVEAQCAVAESLPMADASFDAVFSNAALHWVRDQDAMMAEVRRVLKPGGRFLCLEFSRVEAPGLDVLYERYSFSVLPRLGELVAKDGEAYRYLAESIRKFPPQAAFAKMIERAGLSRVKVRNLTGGIAAMHSAWRI